MKSGVFVDPALDQEFTRRGYVVTPLLTRDDVRALLELRRSKVGELSRDFYSTILDPDVGRRREVQDAIGAVVVPRTLPLLRGYRSCSSLFVDKRASTEKGRVPIHQDPTFVDQSLYVDVHVWIPLVDVNEDNGCLTVFPGTHSLVNHVCTYPTGPSPYDGVMALIESDCGVRLPMAAGTGLVYHGRLLHGSDENGSPAERPAVASIYVPREAKVRFYVRRAGSSTTVDVIEADDLLDFQLTYPGIAIVNPARARQIGIEEHVVERPLEADDIDHLRTVRPRASWLSRLFGRQGRRRFDGSGHPG